MVRGGEERREERKGRRDQNRLCTEKNSAPIHINEGRHVDFSEDKEKTGQGGVRLEKQEVQTPGGRARRTFSITVVRGIVLAEYTKKKGGGEILGV